MGNQKPYFDGQLIKWQNKGQRKKQRWTKHYAHKTKMLAT